MWDIVEGSSVWDRERLGSLDDFVRRLRDQLGLRLSLHVMSHTKTLDEDPAIYRRDQDGDIVLWRGLYTGGYICPASTTWQDLKVRRLSELLRSGVSFLMFDFHDYTVEGTDAGTSDEISRTACWSKDHGHSVPMSIEEHSAGVLEVIHRIKRAHPDVLIEAHDRIAGGLQDYLPLYYEHGRPDSFDEHWGFEYMWNSYLDLLSGKALSLYEYNLAYEIPLYLHINLAFDNENCLAFWWYASTCRHLGIGGVRPSDELWSAHRAAVERYHELKSLLASGRFVGVDVDLHIHTLPNEGRAVLLAFNRSSSERVLQRTFDASSIGIPENAVVEVEGLIVREGVAAASLSIPPLAPSFFPSSGTRIQLPYRLMALRRATTDDRHRGGRPRPPRVRCDRPRRHPLCGRRSGSAVPHRRAERLGRGPGIHGRLAAGPGRSRGRVGVRLRPEAARGSGVRPGRVSPGGEYWEF
ncbi:hypothetical protein GCM10025866_33820 [Naasia aerilata]|uniref:Uncharacterized protein n=1 Tax=Naasia aerilata TaxID=1162966 RepID=A0ABN6XRA8_9MICO|nr:hypothetical protein GCM10025866_33820 [Naasia aerilata]